MSGGDRADSGKENNRFGTIATQPMIVQVVGGVLATGIAALAGAAFTAIRPNINAALAFLVLSVVVIIVIVAVLLGSRRTEVRTLPLVAAAVVIAVVAALCGGVAENRWGGGSRGRSLSSDEHTFSASPKPSISRIGRTVSPFGLQAGDCFDMLNRRSGTLPNTIDIVSCTKAHDAEVFFVGNPWKLTSNYPGQSAVDRAAEDLCDKIEFSKYVGVTYERSFLLVTEWDPDKITWTSSRDRQVECVAYSREHKISYSVKDTKA